MVYYINARYYINGLGLAFETKNTICSKKGQSCQLTRTTSNQRFLFNSKKILYEDGWSAKKNNMLKKKSTRRTLQELSRPSKESMP